MFGPSAPDQWLDASPDERTAGEINDDVCVLPDADGVHFFLRGHIVIPIVDGDRDSFAWTVWVSLSEANFTRLGEYWDHPRRMQILSPMFGWLCNSLPYDEPTLSVKTMVHTRKVGLVPLIEVDPESPHPLAREQRDGITWHRVQEWNDALLGPA